MHTNKIWSTPNIKLLKRKWWLKILSCRVHHEKPTRSNWPVNVKSIQEGNIKSDWLRLLPIYKFISVLPTGNWHRQNITIPQSSWHMLSLKFTATTEWHTAQVAMKSWTTKVLQHGIWMQTICVSHFATVSGGVLWCSWISLLNSCKAACQSSLPYVLNLP